uniref:Protein hfq n=1 Tax=Lygus hesperus TaxID=30085 RepID=A0A0A9YGA2_LYGHE
MLHTNDIQLMISIRIMEKGVILPETQNTNNQVVVQEMILCVPPASEDSDQDHEYHLPPTSEDTDSSFEDDFHSDYNGDNEVGCSDQALSVLQELPPDQREAQSVCVMTKGRGRKQENTKTSWICRERRKLEDDLLYLWKLGLSMMVPYHCPPKKY